MLPEILITSKIGGLVHIGENLLGELKTGGYLSFIGAGSFFLLFSPIASEKIYAPLTVKITIEEGTPHFDCSYVKLFNYKDNTFLLELEPPCLAAHTLPVCLEYKRLENRFTASLIEQNSFYIVIEDDAKQFPDAFFNLSVNKRPSMNSVLINSAPVIIVSDSSGYMYFFTKSDKGFIMALALEANEYLIDNDRIIIKKITTYGHRVLNTYMMKSSAFVLIDSNYEISAQPTDDIIPDFLECIKFGIEKKALSYLSADLDLSFSELKDFIGEFSEFKASPFEDGAYALISKSEKGTYLANRFSFEIIRGRINNIQEL